MVKQGLKESDVINTNFENFKRGHKFEKEAVSVFCNLSNSETQPCGFFEDPSDSNYGASPDALAASSLILEIKTRAAKTEGPLQSLKQLLSYYTQPPPGGGDSHMKQAGMLVVSLRGVNFGLWSRLGCFGQSASILSRQGSFRVP